MTLLQPRRPDEGARPLAGAASRPAWPSRIGAALLKAPIYAYRYSLSLLMGRTCRHLPTCSEYALDAIDINGPWRGAWLTVARCSRCHPFPRLGASSGFDPAPDIRCAHHRWTPWRYGRWRIPRDQLQDH